MASRTTKEIEKLVIRQEAFRRKMVDKYSQSSIGKRFGMHERTVSKIVRRHRQELMGRTRKQGRPKIGPAELPKWLLPAP